MISSEVPCSKCRSPLPSSVWNRNQLTPCPACGEQIQVSVFPSIQRQANPAASGRLIMSDSEASCFFHPTKRAEVSCSMCGRFLCALCDLELHERHLCANCLQTAQKGATMVQLESRRTIYDGAALAMALLPLLIWPITLITGPAAVVLAFISFKKPNSLVTKSPLKAILAILIGGLQIFLWAWALLTMFQSSGEF